MNANTPQMLFIPLARVTVSLRARSVPRAWAACTNLLIPENREMHQMRGSKKAESAISSIHQTASCQSTEASPALRGPPSPLRAFNRARRPLQAGRVDPDQLISRRRRKGIQPSAGGAFFWGCKADEPGPPGEYYIHYNNSRIIAATG